MIIKLTKMGGCALFVEADQVYQQPLANGRVDLEIVKQNAPTQRLLVGEGSIGEDPTDPVHSGLWERAYVMEHGKTVDTIRGYAMPSHASASVNGNPVPVGVTIVGP